MIISVNARLDIQNFCLFAPSNTRFYDFGHFSLPEGKEEICIFSFRGGCEIRVFGQNIYASTVSQDPISLPS